MLSGSNWRKIVYLVSNDAMIINKTTDKMPESKITNMNLNQGSLLLNTMRATKFPTILMNTNPVMATERIAPEFRI